MKASPLLRAWLRRLDGLGVKLETRTEWAGFDERPTILAMGGASWPHLGSDARWVSIFSAAGIEVTPLKPSNCRFVVPWSEHFAARFAGQPIKNVKLSSGGHSARGEIMISTDGIEGGAIYALSRHLRDAPGEALLIDLRPDLSAEAVAKRMAARKPRDSASNFHRKAFNLSPAAIALLRETGATDIKSVPLRLDGPAGLARAISTAGGVARSEVDAQFQLLKRPGTYVVGEMLDWEAPTGGYLLQACFSTAVHAARHLAGELKLGSSPEP